MLRAYFIGGPADGNVEAIPDRIGHNLHYRIPFAPSVPLYEKGVLPSISVEFEVAVYKAVWETERYVVLEYEEPKVDVSVAADITFDSYDYTITDILSWTFLGRGPVGDGITQESVQRDAYDLFTVQFTVSVDGPPDGLAVADATTKVNNYLMRKLPTKATIKTVSASS